MRRDAMSPVPTDCADRSQRGQACDRKAAGRAQRQARKGDKRLTRPLDQRTRPQRSVWLVRRERERDGRIESAAAPQSLPQPPAPLRSHCRSFSPAQSLSFPRRPVLLPDRPCACPRRPTLLPRLFVSSPVICPARHVYGSQIRNCTGTETRQCLTTFSSLWESRLYGFVWIGCGFRDDDCGERSRDDNRFRLSASRPLLVPQS